MKYTKKNNQKNNNDINNKLYLFSEIPKSNIRENNAYSNYNKISNKKYFLDKNKINFSYSYTEANLTDESINSSLLKEIAELKIKIKKYKNELERAKREKNIQKIYINILEQKYISQLISNKENVNYKYLKNNNLFKTNNKSIQNIINESEKNDNNNQNNKNNFNFIYKGKINNLVAKQNKELNDNKYNFSYRNFKRYFIIN